MRCSGFYDDEALYMEVSIHLSLYIGGVKGKISSDPPFLLVWKDARILILQSQ